MSTKMREKWGPLWMGQGMGSLIENLWIGDEENASLITCSLLRMGPSAKE